MTKNSKYQKVILLLIIGIALILRFYKLGEVPPSIDWDEAALGYNAYSLLETGKDEYGTSWPFVFRSFDDYKPPLYFYLTMPSVAVFGLNEFAVRFPSALFGTLTVVLVYFLVIELFKQKDNPDSELQIINLGLVASFLLAISPWHLYFSRTGFEANVGVFFNVLGAYLFLRALQSQKWLFLGSAMAFGLGLYAYHSERIFIPLLILGLGLIYLKELLKVKKYVLLAFAVGAIFIFPLGKVLLSEQSLSRLKGTSSFTDQTGLLARNIVKLEEADKRDDWLGRLLANRRITYAQVLLNGYLTHYNFNWLFITGDQERHKAPGMGLLYWWELPFFLAGLYYLAKNKIDKKTKQTIFLWFLIAPIAASPTTELPHSVRTLVFLPSFQIFTAYGLLNLYKLYRKWFSILKLPIAILYFIFFIFNLIYFFEHYFVHLPIEYSQYWQYGYKQAVEYVKKNYNNYDKIVVSTKLEQPHIFFLFFLHYPPEKYLAGGGSESGGFREYQNKFDKFEFRQFNLTEEGKKPGILYIGTSEEINGDGIYVVDYLDKTRAFELDNE